MNKVQYLNCHSSYVCQDNFIEDFVCENVDLEEKCNWNVEDVDMLSDLLFEDLTDNLLVCQEQIESNNYNNEVLTFIDRYKELCLEQMNFFKENDVDKINQTCDNLKKFVLSRPESLFSCCIYSFEDDVNILISSMYQQ